MEKKSQLTPVEEKTRKEVSSLIESEQSQIQKTQKVKDLLNQGGAIAPLVCNVLRKGLSATKGIVCDGEVILLPDFDCQRKYAETILDAIGERKISDGNEGMMFKLSVEQRGELLGKLDVMLAVLKKK